MTQDEISKLKVTNYVRKAQPKNNYWIDFFKQKLLSSYINKFGDNFNIIIYSKENLDTDCYVIPFTALKRQFSDQYLSNDTSQDRTARWVLNIKNHILKVTNCPFTVDVKDFYSNPYLVNDYEIKPDDNDYEIENKMQEISVRVKQSKFRRKVLENFAYKCCLTNISESELLVASHIVPWKDRKTSRLDPENGLCLFITHDKLFDKGYFTLTDDLRVLTITNTQELSANLQVILNSINGKKIATSIKQINIEYIKYHRDKIFIDRIKECQISS